MAQKISFLVLILVLGGAFASAQDTSTSTTTTVVKTAVVAKPATSIDFLQRFDVDTAAGLISNSNLSYSVEPMYSRTELNASVAFDLGGGLKISPFFRERVETRLTNGTAGLIPVEYTLKTINVRNRLFAGLNSTLAIDKAFNLGLAFEYRVEAVLSDTTSAGLPSAGSSGALSQRFVPYFNVNGKIDSLGYSLTYDLPFYFDASGYNNEDNSQTEHELTANLNYTVKLDEIASLRIDLNNYLDIVNPTVWAVGQAAPILPLKFNIFTPRLTLIAGDFSPFLGFIWNVGVNDALTNTSERTHTNIIGASIGTEIKVGQTTFSLVYDVGVNQAGGATKDRVESHTSASVKIKS